MALWKPIAVFAAGGIGGALGATLLLDDDSSSAATAPASLVEAVTGLGRDRSGAARAGDAPEVAERLDAYREAQAQTDVAALSRDLERLATRSWSPSRDLEIDALLGRLSELAPDYAAELAGALRFDAHFVAQAWLTWADADPDAAIAGLAGIPDAAARREVALALTDIIGDDARGLARIAAALPPGERNALQLQWLARLAGDDPFAAFREATLIGEPALQRSALENIAAVWAGQDPYAALAQADSLPQTLVTRFRAQVFSEWARLDADGYLAYLESTPNPPQEVANGIQYLLTANPELVARAVGNLPEGLAQSARLSVLNAMARTDPERAKAEAQGLPPGQERDQALQIVANALAESSPEAALEWVRNLDPPSLNAERGVTMTMARSDPSRLFAMLDDPASGIDPQLLLSVATSVTTTDPGKVSEFADGLLARSDALSAQALQRLVGNWMQRDPELALEWVLAHGTDVAGDVLATAASTLAARDPAGAAGYVDRIPAAQRGAWVQQVAGQYGRADPHAAMAWISRFQGQEMYDVALRQLISNAAQSDARTAAQLLAQASGSVQLGAAQAVASRLAAQDPREAAQWAQTLSDPRARSSAQVVIAGAWYTSSPEAARSYALNMPNGADRDQTLASLLLRSASAGNFDRALLDGFSNDAARQQAIGRGITMLARNDLPRARAMLDSEITDPAIRAQIETQIRQITTQ